MSVGVGVLAASSGVGDWGAATAENSSEVGRWSDSLLPRPGPAMKIKNPTAPITMTTAIAAMSLGDIVCRRSRRLARRSICGIDSAKT